MENKREWEIIEKMFIMLVSEFGYIKTIDTLEIDYDLELTQEEKSYLRKKYINI